VWLGRLKAAATRVRAATEPSGASERIVGIPEIAVFSELPFAHLGVIGGAEANIVANSFRCPGESRKKVSTEKVFELSQSQEAQKENRRQENRQTKDCRVTYVIHPYSLARRG